MTPKYEQLVQTLRQALPQWYADGQRKLPGEQALAAVLQPAQPSGESPKTKAKPKAKDKGVSEATDKSEDKETQAKPRARKK